MMNNINSMICVNYFFVHSNVNQFCGVFLCNSLDGDVYSCGRSVSGLHGHKDEYIFPPKKISNLNDIKMIYAGGNHTVCLDYNGNCFSFGDNSAGQLGIGKTKNELPSTYIPQKINIPSCKQISCGFKSTICLTENGFVYSMGDNTYNQLGINDNSSNYPKKIPKISDIKYIECGGHHTVCITDDNVFYIWGNNYYGQLGMGNNTNYSTPQICNDWHDNIIDIKCGTNHSLYLLQDGSVYAFGNNKMGRAGLGENIKNTIIPTLITNIPEIKRIECGYAHSMIIDYDNSLWVFGYNGVGQLGLGDTQHRYKPEKHSDIDDIIDISSGGDNIFVKTSENKIYACGNNKNGEIGIKTPEKDQLTLIQVLERQEDIWCSTIGKSKQKSARK